MTEIDVDAWLSASWADRRLSRGERQSLRSLVAGAPEELRDEVRAEAFALARREAAGPESSLAAIDWLEEVVKALRDAPATSPSSPIAEAYFSPGDDCPRAIERLLRNARKTADVCVFTITDDRLAAALLDAYARRIAVRIITDDSKAEDLGSDVDRLASAGIPVKVDRSPFHMHHKFLVVDGLTLLTGSYNWTRGAARDNVENLVITNEPRLVGPFVATFEKLWNAL